MIMPREDDLQEAVAKYLNYQYPKILWCHIANERQTEVKISKKGKAYTPRGSKLKRMGVRAGMPDIMVFERRRISTLGNVLLEDFSGLAIELKIKGGKIQDSQWKVLEQLGEAGWSTNICYSFDEAKEVIDAYLL